MHAGLAVAADMFNDPFVTHNLLCVGSLDQFLFRMDLGAARHPIGPDDFLWLAGDTLFLAAVTGFGLNAMCATGMAWPWYAEVLALAAPAGNLLGLRLAYEAAYRDTLSLATTSVAATLTSAGQTVNSADDEKSQPDFGVVMTFHD
jgi:hypothetical protein